MPASSTVTSITTTDTTSLPVAFDQIASEFTRVRRQLGITQPDLAKALDVTRAALSQWELGRRRPSFEKYTQWAHQLGVDLQISVTIFPNLDDEDDAA